MRFLVLVVVGSAIVFFLIRGNQSRRADEAFERQAEEEARQMQAVREQDRKRQEEVSQRFNCDQARRNLAVLEDASAKGQGVSAFGAKDVPPAEVPAVLSETRQYIAQKC